MKFKLIPLEILFILLFLSFPCLFAEKHLAGGEKVISGNRLVSSLSETGEKLALPAGEVRAQKFEQPTLDGKPEEALWESAQKVSPFLETESSARRDCSVLVNYDKENIYLFWKIETHRPPKAAVTLPDSAFTGESYVQLNLYPILPDSIQAGLGYYYSVAVNPLGTVWDAYWDPYQEGYFFTSWDSHTQAATALLSGGWTVEMVIPFSGLDLYYNSGWNWMLRFHQHEERLASAPFGIQLTQGTNVRRPAWVTYYWDRPELMSDIQPNAATMFSTRRSVATKETGSRPLQDSRMNETVFAGASEIALLLRDDTAEPVGEEAAASFKVVRDDSHIYFLLKAEGGRVKPTPAAAGKSGDAGMAAQMEGVNGVFKDLGLLSTEGFWLIFQPRAPGRDAVHQGCYFISLYNSGAVQGIHYNADGIPDRTWSPGATADLFNTSQGWGAELTIPLESFEIPAGCGTSWGLNVFRNSVTEREGQGRTEAELAAWCPTRGHHYSPEHIGALDGMDFAYDPYIRKTLEQRADKLSHELKKLKSGSGKKAQPLLKELNKLTSNLSTERPQSASDRLENLEQQLGRLKAEEYYATQPIPKIEGYRLNDVCLVEGTGKGWAVGRMGVILSTTDSGRTWTRQHSGTSADLARIQFIDENQGWIVGGRVRMGETNELMRHDQRGGYGYILHTSDSGRTWEIQYAEKGRFLFGLCMLDAKHGWACGERGTLLKTIDGGASWTAAANSGTARWLYDIEFLDPQRGFAVGADQTVLATTDGGASWSAVEAPSDWNYNGFLPVYRAVTFQGELGWIVGQNGTILGSSDGGRSWSVQGDIFKPELRMLLDLENVHFADQERGWAVGRLGTRIMATEDGGASWRLLPVPNRMGLSGVWLGKDGRAVVAGELGTILSSTDSGRNWTRSGEKEPGLDVLALMAHGDDGPISLGTIYAYYSLVEGRRVGDIEILRDWHSVEYTGEIYNLEHHRSSNLMGCVLADYLDEFENGNNGSDYYHFTQRLWNGEKPVIRQLVALLRAYRPEVVLTHDPVFGDYDKPGHKLAGRATLEAFSTAGGEEDLWPELTRLGLGPWQPTKLYCLESESYPETLDLSGLTRKPVGDTGLTAFDWAEWAVRCFQSQGVYHAWPAHLSLMRSLVPGPEKESSIFDGIEK
ncbi:MAG TPA: YCF48-related protein [archaeon]|nr:YCF48-related protein [archaeon]